jgi:5-deoxy-glucuronate isomerase
VVSTFTPSGAAYRGGEVQLDLLPLAEGNEVQVRAPDADELAIVLLPGEVLWLDEVSLRTTVFDDRAAAVYVPPGCTVAVRALRDSELAVCATTAGDLVAGGTPVLIGPAAVTVEHRGRDGWQRDVHDVIDAAVPAQRLLVGETFNAPGAWSSFPPHKHDGRDGEPALEEVYYYRFDQPEGFGFQGVYDRDGNARAEFIRHGSVVGFASGFHPVCAAPGYRLYYLWALAGRERRLAMYEDPAHTWLHGGA